MRVLVDTPRFRAQVCVERFGIAVIKHEERAEFIGERETPKNGVHVETISDPVFRGSFHHFSHRAEFGHVVGDAGGGGFGICCEGESERAANGQTQ